MILASVRGGKRLAVAGQVLMTLVDIAVILAMAAARTRIKMMVLVILRESSTGMKSILQRTLSGQLNCLYNVQPFNTLSN